MKIFRFLLGLRLKTLLTVFVFLLAVVGVMVFLNLKPHSVTAAWPPARTGQRPGGFDDSWLSTFAEEQTTKFTIAKLY